MHYYRVRSIYGDYLSDASENVSVIIVPSPVGIVYTVDESSVLLSWDQVDIATGYTIDRATDSLFTEDVVEFTGKLHNLKLLHAAIDFNNNSTPRRITPNVVQQRRSRFLLIPQSFPLRT